MLLRSHRRIGVRGSETFANETNRDISIIRDLSNAPHWQRGLNIQNAEVQPARPPPLASQPSPKTTTSAFHKLRRTTYEGTTSSSNTETTHTEPAHKLQHPISHEHQYQTSMLARRSLLAFARTAGGGRTFAMASNTQSKTPMEDVMREKVCFPPPQVPPPHISLPYLLSKRIKEGAM